MELLGEHSELVSSASVREGLIAASALTVGAAWAVPAAPALQPAAERVQRNREHQAQSQPFL